jgi:hypothetical protein
MDYTPESGDAFLMISGSRNGQQNRSQILDYRYSKTENREKRFDHGEREPRGQDPRIFVWSALLWLLQRRRAAALEALAKARIRHKRKMIPVGGR